MKRELIFSIAVSLLSLVLLSACAGDRDMPTPEWEDLSSLIDSISATPTKAGKYTLTSEFFEKLAVLRVTEGADSARSVLLTFLSRQHPKIRITDSLAALQMVEWIHNCFTMMDSGGVFFTNGAMDTYAPWYLQRVHGVRPDLIVISLQFLVGADYREFLLADGQVRAALNLSRDDSLPVPPSTRETQDALQQIIIRSVRKPEHPPLYLAPRCGVAERFGGHIVDLGLVHAYQDSIQPETHTLDLLISKLTQDWRLGYASQGPPGDSSYAARFAWVQYLTLVIRMALQFEEQKHNQDIDTLFTYLEPVVGEDWRFSFLRYEHCLRSKDECLQYLEKIKKYASDHPDDRAVQGALRQLEEK
ncbi:MAG: hypothetical protein JSV10_06830 [Candidatus Zixiibacteriota bacterium]|nr:MAG: hypothetical protein JSV10_06830 [candidate division Zixibacteria bacterium]